MGFTKDTVIRATKRTENVYYRIKSIVIRYDGKQNRCNYQFGGWYNKGMAAANEDQIVADFMPVKANADGVPETFAYDDTRAKAGDVVADVKAQIYQYVRELPEFKDAVDILDEGDVKLDPSKGSVAG
jgi:hypothetical protein